LGAVYQEESRAIEYFKKLTRQDLKFVRGRNAPVAAARRQRIGHEKLYAPVKFPDRREGITPNWLLCMTKYFSGNTADHFRPTYMKLVEDSVVNRKRR
jgi:hypothetical protein